MTKGNISSDRAGLELVQLLRVRYKEYSSAHAAPALMRLVSEHGCHERRSCSLHSPSFRAGGLGGRGALPSCRLAFYGVCETLGVRLLISSTVLINYIN